MELHQVIRQLEQAVKGAFGATFAGEEFPDPKWPRHLEDAVHMVGDETFREIMQVLRSRLAGD